MLPTFADPKTDFVFRRIFGNEARKPLLIALLNDLLGLAGEHCILDVEPPPRGQHVAVPELRRSLVDVKCADASGYRFVVRLQVLKIEGFEKHIVSNLSNTCIMQLRETDESHLLCDVMGVTLCDFLLWPEKDEAGQYKVPMLSRWRMQEQHGGVAGLPQVQYVFLELPKYAAGDNPQSIVEKWAYLFREAKNLDVVQAPLAEGPFSEALAVARKATFTPEESQVYERAKMAEQDARGALTVARSEGKAEGRVEGRAEAILAILAARGLPVDEATRATISGCSDMALLEQWLLRALTAHSAQAVIAST